MIENPAPAISMEEYLAALRGDFHTFMRRCFAELNSGVPFLSNWHLATRRGEAAGGVRREEFVVSSSISRPAVSNR